MPLDETAPAGAENALFLHGFWRCGGTWLWSGFRALDNVRAFYEPLHEQLATMRRAATGSVGPGSWASGHSDTPPYFEEYRALIPCRKRGVQAYEERFAFDEFFLDPARPDPALEAYLSSLLRRAAADQRIMVAKFCRSLGRVGWMEARFPGALHAVLLRDPAYQFASSLRLLQRDQNRYFITAPLVVLARNAGYEPVEAASAAMGISLPKLRSRDLAYAVETCWRHVRGLDHAERYRVFLTFWALSSVAALNSTALVIDHDLLAASAEYRAKILATINARTGLAAHLAEPTRDTAAAPTVDAIMPDADIDAAEALAARVIDAFGAALPADRRAIILGKLGARAGPAAAQPQSHGEAARLRPPAVPAAIEVGLARSLARLRGLGWYAQHRLARLVRNGSRDA